MSHAMQGRWTEYAYARLEAIVREQEAAHAELASMQNEWSARRSALFGTLASLATEYEQLYVALDAYAGLESQFDELGVLIAAMPGT